MRPRLGIALGGAALAGVAGASLASWQAGPPTSVRFIAPAGAVGGNVLGSPNAAVPAAGLGTGWLLLRTLPDGTAPAPAAPAAPAVVTPAVVAVNPASAPPAASARSAPATAILASFPIDLPSLIHALPVPVSLAPVSLPLPVGNPRSSHSPAPGHHGAGGHGQPRGGHGQSVQSGQQSQIAHYLRSSGQDD